MVMLLHSYQGQCENLEEGVHAVPVDRREDVVQLCGVTVVLKKCHNGISVVLQWCYSVCVCVCMCFTV
jgi:hypothetical protein